MTVPGADTTRGTYGPPLPPPDAHRHARRRPGRVRLVGAVLVVLSLIPALGGCLVFAEWLPSDIARHKDYVATEPCPARAEAAEGEDCLRTVSLTVESTTNKLTRSGGSYRAVLSGSPLWNGTVSFGGPDPLLERLRPGDRVTATLWRGDVMAVAEGGVRQSTSEEPRDEPQMTVAIGTFLGLLAVGGLWFGAVRLARPRGHEPFTWRLFGKPLLITTLITCVALGLPGAWLGISSWAVPGLAVPVVAGAAWLLHRRRRPRTARGA